MLARYHLNYSWLRMWQRCTMLHLHMWYHFPTSFVTFNGCLNYFPDDFWERCVGVFESRLQTWRGYALSKPSTTTQTDQGRHSIRFTLYQRRNINLAWPWGWFTFQHSPTATNFGWFSKRGGWSAPSCYNKSSEIRVELCSVIHCLGTEEY